MEAKLIDQHTEYLAKLYYLNEVHRSEEQFQIGKRVILQSRTNMYEGTITGFYNIDKASMGLKVDLLGDMEILFFRNSQGYYTSGHGDENHLLLINQSEFGKTLPELQRYWESESDPNELLFMTIGMDVNDLESIINRKVLNEYVKIALNRIISHPNFYHSFFKKDVVFVKFINPEDEKHFQVEFHTPLGVDMVRFS